MLTQCQLSFELSRSSGGDHGIPLRRRRLGIVVFLWQSGISLKEQFDKLVDFGIDVVLSHYPLGTRSPHLFQNLWFSGKSFSHGIDQRFDSTGGHEPAVDAGFDQLR